MTLSELFRSVRLAQRIRQGDVARQVSISHPSLTQFEKGNITLALTTLLRIAPLINVDPRYVSGESDQPFLPNTFITVKIPNGYLRTADLSLLSVLADNNKKLEVILLIVPILFYKKALRSLYEAPVLAMAVKDNQGNIFFFGESPTTHYPKRRTCRRVLKRSQGTKKLPSARTQKTSISQWQRRLKTGIFRKPTSAPSLKSTGTIVMPANRKNL